MTGVRIERNNPLGRQEAKRRIDNLVESLMGSSFPAGVQIADAEKQWSGDAMRFSFKAQKGFMGTTIEGVVTVSDNTVILESEIPGVVRTFVGEDKIRDVVARHLDELLAR